MNPVLEINNLSKRYPKVQAVDGLSLTIGQGSIYGILGPNGSGKTTTLGIVLGVINADNGSFKWFGKELHHEVKRHVGAILETPNFYPYLSAYRNLQIVADIKRVPYNRIDDVLETTGLLNRKDTAFKTFSLGMKQRLALASALLGDPEVLVLDEPTNGLDPQGIAEVRELILQIAAQGKTIIIASHLLDEVEKVCTHVAVLRNGKLMADGPVDTILTTQDQVVICTPEPERALALVSGMASVEVLRHDKEKIYLALSNGFGSSDLNRALFEQGLAVSQLYIRKNSLESQFLQIIKNTK